MRHALVTGASGFIGGHVVRALLARGVKVRALVMPGDPAPGLRGLAVEHALGDVTDRAALDRAMVGIDHVFHLAALYVMWCLDPSRLHQINVEGTRNELASAAEAGVTRVVHTSSIARFGGQGRAAQATEASEFRLGTTGDVYSRSKADAHAVAEACARDGRHAPRTRSHAGRRRHRPARPRR